MTKGKVAVWIVQKKERFIEVWEPLSTKIPGPNLALPYCCYINTVIFYVHHGRVLQADRHGRMWNCNGQWEWSDQKRSFEEWGRVTSTIRQDEKLPYNNNCIP